jgi:tetratricopeptide (TPR) repeat protein
MTKFHPSTAKPSTLLLLLVFGLLAACAAPKYTSDQYREMGWQAALNGDAARAKAYGKKAIAMDPESQWNRVAYGWSLFDLGLYPEALAQWKKSYQRDQEGYRINVCLALACHQTGREKDALDHYTRQVEIEGDFGRWHSLLEATEHWQPNEKKVLHAIYKEWRAARSPQ